MRKVQGGRTQANPRGCRAPDSLIESLDDMQDESVEAAWDEEVVRRMADIDSGAVKPVSLEEARRRLLSALVLI